MFDQNAQFITSIHKLMKTESSELKEPCVCRGICHINHMKHNWVQPLSDGIIKKYYGIKNGRTENGEVMGDENNSIAGLQGGV